ncbi:unnamed protein product [Paramecium sonneborni]|nr:unnamed protein product [Paramecium sonneborni]
MIQKIFTNSTKTQDIIVPINLAKLYNSINQYLDESISTQESQSQIQSVKFQPITSFLMNLQQCKSLKFFTNFKLVQIFLNKYGIDKLGFQRRILVKLDEQIGVISFKGLLDNLKNNQNYLPTIKAWLKSINFQHYYSNFVGYDNFQYFIFQEQSQYKLTLSDLKECILN